MDITALDRDPTFPADVPQPTAMSLLIPGRQGNLLSLLYLPGGEGPYPTVLLCHGYPGNEQNMDLAQALRRIGFAVLTFHYGGSWNSEGEFSLTGCLDDSQTVLDAICAHAGEWNLDPRRLYVVGHSMGGLMASHLLASRDELRAGVLIAPWDAGRSFLLADQDTDCYESLWNVLSCGYGWLRGVSRQTLVRELTAHAAALQIEPLAPRLAQKPILCIAGSNDTDTPPALHVTPLRAAMERAGATRFSFLLLSDDHAFSGHRLTLCRAVAQFLAAQD
jgi:pimeloyl-ACP methyl ester carboxylesterase